MTCLRLPHSVRTSLTAALLSACASLTEYAQAQDGGLDANAGLEGATPTDNVNELGGGANFGGNNAAGGANPSTSDLSDDSVFDDKPVNGAPVKDPALDGASAFSGNNAIGENAAKAAAATKTAAPASNLPVNPAAPLNAAAANALPNNAVPNNAVPSNQVLTSEPAANATAAPASESDVDAPPLPPPNEFAGAPPVPGTMRIMAEGEAPEEYMVQPGDTLFDICDQLLSEAGYWPKLWALNPEIKNPHFIFPNMKLRFYPGDDETPPYLQVVTEDDVIPIDKGDLDEHELVAEKVIYPQDVFEETPATEVIGPSQVEALTDEMLVVGKIFDANEVKLQVPGFIFQQEKEPLAVVVGGREGEISVAPGDRIFMTAVGSIAAGSTYSVLRRGGSIASPLSGDFVGYKYYFVGNVTAQKPIGGDVYVAKMLDNSRLTILPGDIVVNFISTARVVPASTQGGSFSAAQATVVGFQFDGQEYSSHGQTVFLDKGNSGGLSPGQYLPLFQTPGLPASTLHRDLPEDYEQVAVLRVIDTTDAGACAYVVSNSREIRIGDRTFR